MIIKLKDGTKIHCIQIYLSDRNLTYRAKDPVTKRFKCYRAVAHKEIEYISSSKWKIKGV